MNAPVLPEVVPLIPTVSPLAADYRVVDEICLDELAAGLTGSGWVSRDFRGLQTDELLAGLQSEVSVLHHNNAMKMAGIGRGAGAARDPSIRRDRIAWLQGETPTQARLFRCLEQIREGLNQRLFLGLRRFECHYATYEPGAFYRKHIDSFRGRASRVVSLVLYLNDDWLAADGGALQIFSRASSNKICGTVLPTLGRVVLFMSEEIPHEVLTVRRTRHSLACWFRQDEVPIPL